MQLHEEIAVQLQYACPHFVCAQGRFSNEVPFIKLMGSLCSTCKQHATANSRLKPSVTVVNSALLTETSASRAAHTRTYTMPCYVFCSPTRALSLSFSLSRCVNSQRLRHLFTHCTCISVFFFLSFSVWAGIFRQTVVRVCMCVLSLLAWVCVCFRIFRINLKIIFDYSYGKE